MAEPTTDREGASAPSSGAALPGRARRRIVIVSATVSVLTAFLSSAAAQVFVAEPHPPHQDRLVKFEKSGCRELQAFPKHGWVCVK